MERPLPRTAIGLVWRALAVLLALSHAALAIEVDLTSLDSVKAAAGTIAYDMMSYYTGNISGEWNVPGLLPVPPNGYYWWEAGAMWGTMIDYWYITGDTSYNDVVQEALLFQVGPDADYMPPNQSKSLGNDDQGFWGMAVMTAAELNFQNPPAESPQWLALAQAVFNTQASRWDTTSCGGGLKWQIFTFNNGYNYKNSISTGTLFNLGSRLARYTGNATYALWAEKAWDWVTAVGLIDPNYMIYDGSDDNLNCTQINHVQFSYNPGIYLLGAAHMYNYTNGSSLWRNRTQGLLDGALSVFFVNETGIMLEVSCETQVPPTCDTDMLSFKAYLSRWMAAASQVAPFLTDQVLKVLKTSAVAAAKQCSGGSTGRACGFQWTKGATWDGTTGVGQQMNALEVIISTQIGHVNAPVTNATGGTSVGNPNAGSSSASTVQQLEKSQTITTGDKVGAGILTTVVIAFMFGGLAWMVLEIN